MTIQFFWRLVLKFSCCTILLKIGEVAVLVTMASQQEAGSGRGQDRPQQREVY